METEDIALLELARREITRLRESQDKAPVYLSDEAVSVLGEGNKALGEAAGKELAGIVKAITAHPEALVKALVGVANAVNTSSKAANEAIGRLEKATRPADLSGVVKAIEMATATILSALDKLEPVKEVRPPVQFNIQRDDNGYMRAVVVGEYKPAPRSKTKLTIN